ncbi:hypothetical protein [Bradyrhizobium sp. UFLA03-84]|uniref:hypothetical protein n=1 Tax=Bradyrhizobium sp. UFLA03-84 TaxID=418599 RepID=UPI00117867E8|nr:hypothetical protein [Bradyrhizobium sp. UFLA03-84]
MDRKFRQQDQAARKSTPMRASRPDDEFLQVRRCWWRHGLLPAGRKKTPESDPLPGAALVQAVKPSSQP